MKSLSIFKRNYRGSDGDRALTMIPSANVVRCRRQRGKGIKRKERKKRAGKRRRRKKADRLACKYIRVGYWNCRSAKTQAVTIQKLIYDFDILMLQETLEKRETTIKCPGYGCYTSPSGPNRRGLAIYIRDGMRHWVLNTKEYNSDGIEIQGLTVLVENQEWRIYNVYAHVDHLSDECNWEFLSEISDSGGKCLIAGDFNARSKEWGNPTENRQGIALSQALISSNLTVINDGRTTRMATRPGDSDGVLDLALVSDSEAPSTRWDVLGVQESDHLPCSVLIPKGNMSMVTQNRPRQAFHYRADGREPADPLVSLRKMAKQRTRKTVFFQPPWWNATVEKVWVAKEQAAKQWQRLRHKQPQNVVMVEEMRREKQRKCNEFKIVATDAKDQAWELFVSEVAGDKSLHKFWQFQRRMNRKGANHTMPHIQTVLGTMLKTDEEKGHELFQRYLGQSDKGDRCARQNAKDYIQQRTQGKNYNELVTMGDVKCALRGSKNGAPGPDGVRYGHIGKLSDSELQCVVRDFNLSIQTSKIPVDWLDSYLKPYPKLGRDPSQLNGYRIITLQNVYGKLLEKIISKKIMAFLESSGVLPNTMGSYRPSKATWDNAGIFSYDVYEGFQNKKETVAVAIDLEDAYNSVVYEHLVRCMLDCGIDAWLVNWIAANLMERTVAFRLGTWTSEPVKICPGLPQGSPLSPVLFNIYTAKLAKIQPIGLGRTLSFADDVLLYRTGSNRQEMVTDLEETLDRMSDWCKETNSVVNPRKASVLWCSLNNAIGKANLPSITFNGQTIEKGDTLKYLGVTFDRGLSFKKHVDSTIMKCKHGLSALKSMMSSNMEQRLLFLLFNHLVLSVIDYALGTLTLSTTQCEKLEKIQNEGMRIVLGCTRDTPITAMRYILGLTSVESRHALAQVKAYMRVTEDDRHPLFISLDDTKGRRLKRGKSWMAEAEDTIGQVMPVQQIHRGPEWILSIKCSNCTHQVIITLGRVCREWCDGTAELAVLQLIDTHVTDDETVMYTDGSVHSGDRSGWGFSARVRGRVVAEQSGAYKSTTSSMRMEIAAITAALRWLSGTSCTKAIIVTDSQSVLRKIQSGYLWHEWVPHLESSKVRDLVWIYCPGHAGVRGNERADRLASTATVAGTLKMDKSDIVKKTYERMLAEDTSTTELVGARMTEFGIKRGSGRRGRLRGRIRRVYNQRVTGTISVYTLRHLLGETEQLWGCPECKDVSS